MTEGKLFQKMETNAGQRWLDNMSKPSAGVMSADDDDQADQQLADQGMRRQTIQCSKLQLCSRRVVIVNKNSNQSQALKLVCLHTITYFFYCFATYESGQMRRLCLLTFAFW